MVDFVHPFPGKNPGDELTDQEIISALRLSLCAEEEATHLYDTIANYVGDERISKIMKDVADEEQVHIGEFQKLLDLYEKDEEEKVGEGKDEAKEKMEGKEVAAGYITYDDLRQRFINRMNSVFEHCGKCPGDPGVPDKKKGVMDEEELDEGSVADEPRGEGDVKQDIKPRSMFAKKLDSALDKG